jgi:anaerobic ribonucleoside-triphosphate reductase
MTDPLTITAIITGVASAIVAILGGLHYKLKMRCCMCCESDCTENETQREIKKINKNNFSVSSIKSI